MGLILEPLVWWWHCQHKHCLHYSVMGIVVADGIVVICSCFQIFATPFPSKPGVVCILELIKPPSCFCRSAIHISPVVVIGHTNWGKTARYSKFSFHTATCLLALFWSLSQDPPPSASQNHTLSLVLHNSSKTRAKVVSAPKQSKDPSTTRNQGFVFRLTPTPFFLFL